MKTILYSILVFFVITKCLNAMMDEDGDFFPVSSGVSRKVEQEALIKDIAELKLQKAQLEQEIENRKKQLSQYDIELKALAALRRIRQNQQESEAATLLARAFVRLQSNEALKR